MLSVEDLSVSYGEIVAVDHAELSVADGEIVSVLGPSGSGKSTLLRAIAGLAPGAQGRVTWDGADLASVPTHQRDFGLMFQDHALFPHRDVVGNVAFGLRMRGIRRGDAERRASETLALVGLAGFEHRRIPELSGGEQQRVALARALAPEPRLLMLDEPLGALDRALRDHLVGELRTLFTALHLSVIFVTHDHDEAFAVADRVAVMWAGQVAQVGSPSDVWRRPATGFVARFLGWNMTGAFGEAVGAVRPDDLELTPSGEGVRATVVTRTFRRDHHLVTALLPSGEELRVAVPADVAPPEVGDDVHVALRAGATLTRLPRGPVSR